MAQGLFSPAITVNDKVVTNYEINQRVLLLQLFRTPGNLPELAREQLIDDRLKAQELDRAGLRLSEEALETEMTAFAQRANLGLDQFIAQLASAGIAEATIRDFVGTGAAWREYIRSRYGARVEITEADIDRALGQSAGNGIQIQVLLSEIILPAPEERPEMAAQAAAIANDIAQMTSTAAFSAAAREYSALPTRENGGRLGWLPITNYPPQLRGLILSLDQNAVTAPLPIPNGIALFQMRGVREVTGPAPEFGAIEYAALYLPGGRTEAGLAAAARVRDAADTCDDLYGIAQDMPEEALERITLPPAEIPSDVAIELARLDPGEVSTTLTSADGQTLVFLMLCGRTPVLEGEVDRGAIRNQLRGQRLTGLADALIADLRASATIVTQ
ncbi:peptidylprolyl isomerase [Loktanella sp. IMCC34160]|nr:peptidylprolyl isomerase [Loktanella sp. IMCC34160]